MATSLFTGKGTNIDTKQILKADSYEELREKINARLGRKYPISKVVWIKGIQAVYENWDMSKDEVYTDLCKRLSYTIDKKAQWMEYRYRSARLSYHDFEAEYWKITYHAIESYEEAGDIDSEFTLVETIEMFWKYRMIDFIRSCLYTDKHSWWFKAASLSPNLPDASSSPEQGYIIKETVTEIFNDDDLKEKERMLLEVIYDYPDEGLRDWGQRIGIDHPETVRRLYQSLKRKLAKYNPY